MAKVTTGTGDTGYTSLLGDMRVPKYDPRPDTYGTVDEATSALGMARAFTQDERARALILTMQQDLFVAMAELATPLEHQKAVGMKITARHTQRLEEEQQALQREVVIPERFIIPGDSAESATLDVARTVIRRAERMTVRLLHDHVVDNPELVRYLNRLSDVVFVLARYLEAKRGQGSTLVSRKSVSET